jgi:tRNA threonylcarbamoyl adenosine modification protein YjeE
MQKRREEFLISHEKELDKIAFPLLGGDVIFFRGDLGSGKSTFIRSLLRRHFENQDLIVRSPTYTYYQSYENIYHFDLYRIEDPSVWMSI